MRHGPSVTVAWGLQQEDRRTTTTRSSARPRARSAAAHALLAAWSATQVETDVLRTGVHTFQGGRKKAHVVLPGSIDYLSTFTAGASHTFWAPRTWDFAAGADVTGYVVPSVLQPTHGDHPVSFHLYLRVRVPSSHRMTDVTMTSPM